MICLSWCPICMSNPCGWRVGLSVVLQHPKSWSVLAACHSAAAACMLATPRSSAYHKPAVGWDRAFDCMSSELMAASLLSKDVGCLRIPETRILTIRACCAGSWCLL